MKTSAVERIFRLKEHNTNVRTEITAGITTFMTMAYILAVNPAILGAAGMDPYAVMLASALAAAIGTLCMAAFANYPFVLAPAMGCNAVFTYTVVLGMGVSWQMALFAVFVEGLIFLLLSLFNIREAIFNAFPYNLKQATSAGIGLFIAFVGLQNAGLVIGDPTTLVNIVNFTADFHNTGLTALLALLGLLLIAVLLIRGVTGGILLGMLLTWGAGIVLEFSGIYTPSVSCIPVWEHAGLAPLKQTLFACFRLDFADFRLFDFIVIIFTFLFMDLFDTLATLMGVASKANMLDEQQRLPNIKGALFADAIATTAGALLGTSTTGTYVESAAGCQAGGRTGLTALTAAALFLLSIFIAPLIISIPYFATAPALIVVGVYMISAIKNVELDDFSEAIPAFITVVMMPLTYSVVNGIFLGIISYAAINLLSGKHKEKQITPMIYGLAILFICKYIFL